LKEEEIENLEITIKDSKSTKNNNKFEKISDDLRIEVENLK
jgi:hypothetical protein